jgi:hypothetical protein
VKTLLALFAVCWGCGSAVLTVCPGGPGQGNCATPAQTRAQLQSAIDQAQPGDEIEMPPGDYQVDGTLYLKRKTGDRWITIRTSRVVDLPPEGYRVNESHSALMPRIWCNRTLALIDTVADHALNKDVTDGPFSLGVNGNLVTIGGDCSETSPCRARARNGAILTLTAPVGTVELISAPPSAGTLRIGLNNEGKLTVKKSADMEPGKHFTCTNCADPVNYSIANYSFEYPPDSLGLAAVSYNTSGWTALASRRAWLAGPCVNDANCHGLFPAAPENVYSGPAAGPHHYRFVGIHFTQDRFQYYLVSLGMGGVTDWRDLPHDIEFDRCLLSGKRNLRGPGTGIGITGENITVKNSSFLWFSRNDGDGQQILVHSGAPGPVHIENNSLDGAVENFMAGGTGSSTAAYVPVLRFRRNYVWKRLDHWANVAAIRSSPAVLRLRSAGGQPCDAAKGLDVCFYHRDEVRHSLTEDSYATLSAGVTGTLFLYIDPLGRYVLGHPWSESDVACSGQLVCVAGVSAVPEDATGQYAWNVTNGELDASASIRREYNKNLWECKNCKDSVVEGNVFRGTWKDLQATAFTLTPRNQYGHETWVRIDNVLFERNLLVGATSLAGVTNVDDLGGNTYTRDLRFRHNIWMDVDESHWSNTTNGFAGGILLNGNGLEFEMDHNTLQLSDSQGYCETRGNRLRYRNNLVLWNGQSNISSRGISPGFANSVKAGFLEANSEYSHNVNLSGGGADIASYPPENWGEKADPSNVLVKLSTPASLSDNFRIKPGSQWSASCTLGCAGPSAADGSKLTTDGLDPGADVDWVETLTDGVVEGLPELSVRWDLQIEPKPTGALFRYSPPAQASCSLQAATHQSLRAAFLVADTDTAEKQTDTREGNSLQDGRRTFDLGRMSPLAPGTSYWYRLSCDGKVVKGEFTTSAAE